MVWYGIVGFNVSIDTLQVISETIAVTCQSHVSESLQWRLDVYNMPTGVGEGTTGNSSIDGTV